MAAHAHEVVHSARPTAGVVSGSALWPGLLIYSEVITMKPRIRRALDFLGLTQSRDPELQENTAVWETAVFLATAVTLAMVVEEMTGIPAWVAMLVVLIVLVVFAAVFSPIARRAAASDRATVADEDITPRSAHASRKIVPAVLFVAAAAVFVVTISWGSERLGYSGIWAVVALSMVVPTYLLFIFFRRRR